MIVWLRLKIFFYTKWWGCPPHNGRFPLKRYFYSLRLPLPNIMQRITRRPESQYLHIFFVLFSPIFSHPIQHKQTVMIFCLLWSGLERFFIKLRDWSLTPTQTYCVLLSILYILQEKTWIRLPGIMISGWEFFVKLTFHHGI